MAQVQWYITAAQLAERPGMAELSQVTAEDGEIPAVPELLNTIIQGGDTSPWTADELVMAELVFSRIDESIEDAQAMIDGYLRQRGHRLPLAIVPRQLANWARAIVRYQLSRNRTGDERTDPIVRDYRDALKFLQRVADGSYSLGIDDKMPVAGGPPQVTGPGRIFSMDTLRDYGK
ncbi:TPA: gp436 family protein [Serratia marcescens]